jgi:hypothetical protein
MKRAAEENLPLASVEGYVQRERRDTRRAYASTLATIDFLLPNTALPAKKKAERAGFEPAVSFWPTRHFQCRTFGRSVTSPENPTFYRNVAYVYVFLKTGAHVPPRKLPCKSEANLACGKLQIASISIDDR